VQTPLLDMKAVHASTDVQVAHGRCHVLSE
jgi:hypothetical protein